MKVISDKRFIASVLGGLSLLIAFCGAAIASGDSDTGREVSVTLNAGETYIIKDLSHGATPAVHVEQNPNALIVHTERSGDIVLLGAAAGKWKIDVKAADGKKVTYEVQVNAIARPYENPLAPGTNPPALGAPHFGSAADKSTATTLDSGAGRVAAAATVADSPGASRPSTAGATDAAAAGPLAGTAAMTAAAVSAIAPASVAVPPAPAAPAPIVSADASASGSSLPPVPSAVPAPPSASSAPAPAAPPKVADAGSTLPPVGNPTYTRDNMSSGSLMPSQSIPTNPSQVPMANYKANPLVAEPHSDSVNGGTHYLPEDVVNLPSGSSRIFDFPRRIRRISIADTEVADLQVINPYQINLIGHKEGFTTLAVWDRQGQYEERQIRIDSFGKQQVMLNVIVAELDRNRLEGQGINWTFALPKYNVSLFGLGGSVASQFTGSSNLTASEVFGAGTQNPVVVSSSATGTLPGAGSLIPLLLSTNVNYGLAAGNSNVQTQTFFEFMEQHNLAKILAEPHLLANSGEKAEFLSGGEIPIVISQALNTSIVFKQFGTSVIFVPTVIGKDDIGLRVKPEVSQPDFSHGVNLFGFTVPAFVTRRAETFVRLKNNQTLIIAGLLLRTKTSNLQKTPYLGDIPYLGYLFKSTTYQENMTDLVMSVTPQIVQPLPADGQVALPTDRPPMSFGDIQTQRVSPVDVSRPRF